MTPKQRYSISDLGGSFSVSARTQSLSLPELDSKDVQWANLSFHAKNFGVEVSTDIQFRSLRAFDFETVLLASSKGTPIKHQTPQAAEMTIITTIDPSFRSPVYIHNKIWFNPKDAAGKINTASILWVFRVQPAQPTVITIWLTPHEQFVIFSPTIGFLRC
jgi:hypothetical protein